MIIGLLMLLMKWNRLFYVLLSFEFMMMDLFFWLSFIVGESFYFCFICFCVIISILGLLVLVSLLKFFGSDSSFF
uniref:NADH dehydrogenase subunit 4L n=1 Tax=Clavinema parasiluri TaxID=332280 RepID=A0A9F2HGX9_9BILA|nr:NADH dehydrogenase subunit 4L [Clavinema parasiluri]WAX01696.1 NADH dehydrogenase subunit 4L [Clavinema parasiluri]